MNGQNVKYTDSDVSKTFCQYQDQDQDFSRNAELLNISRSQNKHNSIHTDVRMYHQSFFKLKIKAVNSYITGYEK